MKRCGFVLVGLLFACSGSDLEILTSTLPDVDLGGSYDQKIEVVGGKAPYTFAIDSGALADGLELKAATGQISGVAAEPGRAMFAVAVTEAGGDVAKKDLSLYVRPESLQILTTMLEMGKEGEPYDQPLTAKGGVPPYTWSLDSGELPAGLSIAAEGRVSGTPSVAGGFDFQVKVADSEQTARLQMLNLFLVSRDPAIETSTIPKARQGEPYSTTLVAQGGTPPYTWEHFAGALPTGVQLANDGTLTGVPTEAGDFPFNARVTDSDQRQDMVALMLRVIAPLEITSTALPQIIVGRTIDFFVAASGGEPPYTWSLDGSLPAGVTFDAAGHLVGGSAEVGVSAVTVRVTDSEGFRDSALFDLRVTDRYTFEVMPNLSFPPTCTGTTVSSLNVEIPVTESFAIDDIDVGVALSYVNQGGGGVANDELKVQLFSPRYEAQAPLCGDGAEVPGGYECLGFGGFDKTYDDEGGAQAEPDRPLSAFDGLNPNGTWILRVAVATPSCNRTGTVDRVTLSIRDDRDVADYAVIRGFTRNNLLLAPWVRVTTSTDRSLDQHDIFLTATVYSVGPNGVKEAGRGDDVPNPVPLTWQWTGAQINGASITADGHVRAGAITGATTVTASGGGYVINVPLYVTAPDWNPLVRIP